MGLTGGYRFRKGLRGKTVLQVEEEFTPFWSASGVVKRRWRDATMIDLADPTLRSLIDLGAGKLRFPSRSNALGGLLPNASRTDGGIQQQAAAKAMNRAGFSGGSHSCEDGAITKRTPPLFS